MKKTAGDEELLNYVLSSFSCAQDRDIQNFLCERAVKFERLAKSRTYLIIDESQFLEPDFALDRLIIYGYISLSVKVFTAPETISNRQRLQLDGFSAKEHGKPISNFPCYLIGQLARNSNVPKGSLKGSELLDFAYGIIAISVDAVGGRNIMVECRNIPKLTHFYISNGFFQVSQIPDENIDMVQMLRRI